MRFLTFLLLFASFVSFFTYCASGEAIETKKKKTTRMTSDDDTELESGDSDADSDASDLSFTRRFDFEAGAP